MSERINKTSIYSIIFLDIIDYSKKAVYQQFEIKEAFNTITTQALEDVAQTDRIILDTGDGLAIALLGEPQEALFVSLTIRDDILQYNIDHQSDLFVRIGINLGPVRIVKDINGMPNIIGDGINVAERVMSFAKPNQILVSRTYYEVTSRLTDEINVMFSYFGMKQDKHVREHEIYEIKEEAKTIKSSVEINIDKQNKTAAVLPPSNDWLIKAQLLNKRFWIQNKYYLLGLAFLLANVTLFIIPKSPPDISTQKNTVINSNPNDILKTAPNKPGNNHSNLVLNNIQKTEPTSGINTDEKSPNEPVQHRHSTKKESTKKLHAKSVVTVSSINRQSEYKNCTQGEKALNQCH